MKNKYNKKIKFLFILYIVVLIVEIYFVYAKAQSIPVPLVTGPLKYTSEIQSKHGNLGIGQAGNVANIIFSSNPGRSCIIFGGNNDSTCLQDNLKKIEYRYASNNIFNELKFYPSNSKTSMTIRDNGSIYFNVDHNEQEKYWKLIKVVFFNNVLFDISNVSDYDLLFRNKVLQCDTPKAGSSVGYVEGINCNQKNSGYRNNNDPPKEGDIGYDVVSVIPNNTCNTCYDVRYAVLKYVKRSKIILETPKLYLLGAEVPFSGEWCGATVASKTSNNKWRIFHCGDKFPDESCPPGYAKTAWGYDVFREMTADIITCFKN